jgi:RNA polymerase sigma factor (TIGR02999 family)
MDRREVVTGLLSRMGQGGAPAMDRLIPLVYDELHELAHRQRARWGVDERVPGTTSLVHEAYVRLVDQTRVQWQSRGQFFAIACRAMRTILIDNARRAGRQKRGGGVPDLPLDAAVLVSADRTDELLALDQALERLEGQDPRLVRIVECRVFGGLSIEETARALAVSPATVKRGWNLARTWLFRELHDAPRTADEG